MKFSKEDLDCVWLANAVLAFKREGYKWSDISLIDLKEILSYPGFYRLAGKYLKFGTMEVLRSAFISLSIKVCLLHPQKYISNWSNWQKELQKYIPNISAKDIQKGPAGVRAQAMNYHGDLVGDFIFDKGMGGKILHCRNAPSPGATSSLAIARMMTDKTEAAFGLEKRPNAKIY